MADESVHVRMTDTERLNTIREDAERRRQERKEAEKRRQEQAKLKVTFSSENFQIANKESEIANLKAELTMQKLQNEISEKQKEIGRLNEVIAMKEKKYPTPSGRDYETLKKTVYGHASQESRECQMAVAFVVLNRTRANQEYWGGSSITAVCRKPGQFWPWNDGKDDVEIKDWGVYNSIDEWLPAVLNGQIQDNTDGSDHLLPKWETHHDWLNNVVLRASHGNFNFYKAKWLM